MRMAYTSVTILIFLTSKKYLFLYYLKGMSRKVKNNGVQNTNKTETCENICLNVLQEFRKL